jgi:membrane-associated protein
MDLIYLLQQLDPVLLVVVVAALCFIEECGVPVPFAPGDVMLMIGGLAIAGHAVDPILFLAFVFVASAGGALLGREIFAGLGRPALMKVANRLHCGRALEKAERMVRRSGWRAICFGRLIPGLRVHTTQVAGVSQMPRLTFLAGLLPAVAIYIGVFTGLGIALGPSALELLHQIQHQLIMLVLIAAPLLAGMVVARCLVRQVVALRKSQDGILRTSGS